MYNNKIYIIILNTRVGENMNIPWINRCSF